MISNYPIISNYQIVSDHRIISNYRILSNKSIFTGFFTSSLILSMMKNPIESFTTQSLLVFLALLCNWLWWFWFPPWEDANHPDVRLAGHNCSNCHLLTILGKTFHLFRMKIMNRVPNPSTEKGCCSKKRNFTSCISNFFPFSITPFWNK